MLRRTLILGSAARAAAQPDGTRQALLDIVARIANALSESRPASFLEHFDREMPEYARLERYVTALTEQSEAGSSIVPLENRGGEAQQTIELDWRLELRSRSNSLALDRRRARVTLRFERRKDGWTVSGLDPVDFFAPPKFA